MLNRLYIDNTGELYTVYGSDTEDDYNDEDKEVTQPFPFYKVTWQHLSLQLCTT
jgi:hypothetical protein